MVAHRAHTKSMAAVAAMDMQAVGIGRMRMDPAVANSMGAAMAEVSTVLAVTITATTAATQSTRVPQATGPAIMAPTMASLLAPTVARTATTARMAMVTALTTVDMVTSTARILHRTVMAAAIHLAAAGMAHNRTRPQAPALHTARTQLQHQAQDLIKHPAPILDTQALDRLLMARHQALARILGAQTLPAPTALTPHLTANPLALAPIQAEQVFMAPRSRPMGLTAAQLPVLDLYIMSLGQRLRILHRAQLARAPDHMTQAQATVNPQAPSCTARTRRRAQSAMALPPSQAPHRPHMVQHHREPVDPLAPLPSPPDQHPIPRAHTPQHQVQAPAPLTGQPPAPPTAQPPTPAPPLTPQAPARPPRQTHAGPATQDSTARRLVVDFRTSRVLVLRGS